MRYDSQSRTHPARTDAPPPDPSPEEKALAAACVAAVGAWLAVHPMAGAAALVALGLALALVGVPLAVVRGVLAVDAAWRRRRHRTTVRDDPDADVSDSTDAAAPVE